MLFAARVPVSVGVIHWPSAGVATIVIKRSYDLGDRGVAAPSPVQEPLGLDRHDGSGALLHPSDFAPTKAMCDVAVVGAALHDPRGPVRIVVGEMRRLVDRAATAAPRPSPGPHGDPTDAALAQAWTTAGFDFERFQWAPREQRMPFPALPLDVVVDVGAHRSAVRLEGPAPEVLVVDETGRTAPRPVLVRLDGIGLDLARRRIDLVWRGLAELGSGAPPLLVIDPAAALPRPSMREVSTWSRAEAVEPRLLRRLAARGGTARARETVPLAATEDDTMDSTTEVGLDDFGPDSGPTSGAITSKISVLPPDDGDTCVVDERRATMELAIPAAMDAAAPLPFERGGQGKGASNQDRRSPRTVPIASSALERPASRPRETLSDVDDPLVGTVAISPRPGAPALPFSAIAIGSAASPASPGAPAAPRPRMATIADGDDAASDPLVGTVAVSRSPAAALPFAPAASVGSRPSTAPVTTPVRSETIELDIRGVDRVLPDVVLLGVAASMGAEAARPPARVETSHVPAEVVEGIGAERFAAIKAALWARGSTRRSVTLAEHGVSDLEWRLAEKRFAAALTRRTPEELRAFLAAMRAETSKQTR